MSWSFKLIIFGTAALALLVSGLATGQVFSNAQKTQALDQAWSFARDNFYDEQMHGVDWTAVHDEFATRLAGVRDSDGMRALMRDMLARLHNSHTGLITRDELARIRTVLPFAWEKTGDRVFVSYVFRLKNELNVPVQFGDEVLSVDGQPASQLWQVGVTHLDDIRTNPYTGMPGSVADVRLRRHGRTQEVHLARVHRSNDVQQWEHRALPGGGFYLRLLTLGKGTISDTELPHLLRRASASNYVVVDLRHCVGGDSFLPDRLAGFLLGPDIVLGRIAARGTSEEPTADRSVDVGLHYARGVAVLIDRNSESQPEAFAAALKEYGRARLFGGNTRGAWSGWSKSTGISGIGMIAVPYARSISPKGNDYEGVGVGPDLRVAFTGEDFARKRDPVIDAATESYRSQTR
jgi:tricorn protease